MNESDRWRFFKKVPPITLLPMPNITEFSEHHEQKEHDLPCESVPVKVKGTLSKSNADHHDFRGKLWIKSVVGSPRFRLNQFSRLESDTTQNSFREKAHEHEERNSVSIDIIRSAVTSDSDVSFERRHRRRHQERDQYQCEKFLESSILQEILSRNDFPVFHASSSSNSTMDSSTKFRNEDCSLLSMNEDQADIVEFAQLEFKRGKANVVYKRARSITSRENSELLGFQPISEYLFATAMKDSECSLSPFNGLISKAA
jgi:hypothetical protein